MRSNLQLEPVVQELEALVCHFDTVDVIKVGQIMTRHGITVAEFLHLDESPGIWPGEWHYKLRRFRNSGEVRSYIFTRDG